MSSIRIPMVVEAKRKSGNESLLCGPVAMTETIVEHQAFRFTRINIRLQMFASSLGSLHIQVRDLRVWQRSCISLPLSLADNRAITVQQAPSGGVPGNS